MTDAPFTAIAVTLKIESHISVLQCVLNVTNGHAASVNHPGEIVVICVRIVPVGNTSPCLISVVVWVIDTDIIYGHRTSKRKGLILVERRKRARN